jgi:predicted ABC-type ATPase
MRPDRLFGDVLTMRVPSALPARTAHDSGDGAEILHCLEGATRYLTRDGVRTLAETAGTAQLVLSGDPAASHAGRWTEAEIRDFGIQPLREVVLKRNRKRKVIRATSGHRWLVRRPDRVLTTDQLIPGHRLASLRAPAVEPAPDHDGIRMGFVFGDGEIMRRSYGSYGAVTLWGNKRDLAKYFDEIGGTPHEREAPSGLPGLNYSAGMLGYSKELPPLTSSPEYLRGWLMGYFAADGEMSTTNAGISSASLETLLHVRDIATLLGIGTYEPLSRTRTGFGRESAIHIVGFSRADLTPGFFLRDDQRAEFERHGAGPARERFGWTVESIGAPGEPETVYCAVVPGFESFTLEDNIHTGNCPFCGAGQVIGRSDGTAECEFDGMCFTVQVQPRYPGFPQSVNGQPVPVPGMPGQPGGVPGIPPAGPAAGGVPLPGEEDGAVPGAEPGNEGDEGAAPPVDGQDAEDDESDDKPDFLKKSTRGYRTAAGDILPEDAYLRHLALEVAPDRQAMLERLRAASRITRTADSLEEHAPGGQLTPERQKLHDSIVSGALEGHGRHAHPVATFLGGGPASGKSTIAGNQQDSVHIDADAVKKQLPDYHQKIAAGDKTAAAHVHEESSHLTRRIMDEAVKGGRNFTLDGTGDSDFAKLNGKISQAKKAGHMVAGKYVTVDTDEAVRRAKARAERPGSGSHGRMVPESVIRQTHKNVSGTFRQAVDHDVFDSLELWDNNDKEPRLVGSKPLGGKWAVHDHPAYQRFLAKEHE